MTTKPLSDRRAAFVREYLVDLNATQAAIRAGYRERTARQQGDRLLTNVDIQNALSEAMRARSRRTEITADRVLTELARVAFGDPRRVMSWGPDGIKLRESADLTDDEAAIVAEVAQTTTEGGGSLKVKTLDKMRALELIGRHLAMFTDRSETSGTLDVRRIERVVVDPMKVRDDAD